MAKHPDFAADIEVREAAFGRYQLRPRDLLHIRAHRDEHELGHARVCVDYVNELRHERGRKLRMLIDIRGIRGLSAGARRLYGSDEHVANIVAVALVTDGGLSRVIGNFALGLRKAEAPMRMFSATSDAIEWLESMPDG